MQAEREQTKKRIGILRGGTGKHYATSLKKGGDVILHIAENLNDIYKVSDILIDKDYLWHHNGVPISPSDLVHKVDIVWNTTHPSFSNILDSLSIPNIHVDSFYSALENNREMLQKHVKNIGVRMPRSMLLPVYQEDFDGPREQYAVAKARAVHEKFGAPWMVRSYTPDENMAIHLARTFPELVNAIEDGVKHEKSILVEEFIPGKVASVHSVSDFRGQPIYTFPIVNSFGVLSPLEKEKLAEMAKDLHTYVGAKHYLKSDFVLSNAGKIYLLQIEGTPDLHADSHFSQAAEAVGASTTHVLRHILEQNF